MSRVDRINRVVATLVGLALTSAGAYALLRASGVVGDRRQPVLGEGLRRAVVDNAGLVGGVATFVALLVAWGGWQWLRAQLRPAPSLPTIRLADGPEGRTTLETKAVADAVARDLEAARGVASGRARFVGAGAGAFAVDLHADLAGDADLVEVRRHVDEVVLPRLRGALEAPGLAASARYRFGSVTDRSVS